MIAKVVKTNFKAIQSLRTLFLHEANVQIRYNACHERGWADSYLLTLDDDEVGYGSVKGRRDNADRDTVFEFFVVRSFRKHADLLFGKLLEALRAKYVECQSNDALLTSLIFAHARTSART